jgi:hypothetical protein
LRCKGGFPGPDEVKVKMWKLKLMGLLMTIVYWAFSLILIYSVMMSIFRYAFGVQLPNPFSIFQGP